jgi:hypothetical protein
MGLMDDLVGCLQGPTILGAAPVLGADARTFHRKLRDVLFRNPDEADRIAPRIEAVYRGLWPGAPPAVWRDCAMAHLRLACVRPDLGPAPAFQGEAGEPVAPPEPLGHTARKRRLLAAARPVLDAERKRVRAAVELAMDERSRQWALDATHTPDPRRVRERYGR